MTVFILVNEHWEETDIEGVYLSLENAKASVPKGTWVRCGDGVELAGLKYGHRVTIQPHTVKD